MKLNVIIVDDEMEACENLENIIEQYIDADINVLGVANDTEEAARLITMYNPDAVFLDIELPGENAFQFLSRIHPYAFEIVFITAYDEFAIKAFKLNAIDYIQKPIDIEELAEAVIKLREKIYYKQIVKAGESQIGVLKQIVDKAPLHKITLRSLNQLEVVEFKDIYYIEGQGSYCKVSFSKAGINKVIITSSTVSYYEELLPVDMFHRVHKSFLLNCMHIDAIIADEHAVVLKNHEKIPVSRRRFAGFIDFIKEANFHSA